LSFSLGLGAALNGPGWQAIVPELVERSELRQAITLNSIPYNAARGVGPAIGGMAVAVWGAGAAFLANATSFAGIIFVLASWRRKHHESILPAERVIGAIRAGARYVRYTPALRSVIVRGFTFGVGTSAMWATLPLVARVEFHLDATGYEGSWSPSSVSARRSAAAPYRWRDAYYPRTGLRLAEVFCSRA
jgi:MFS family permease